MSRHHPLRRAGKVLLTFALALGMSAVAAAQPAQQAPDAAQTPAPAASAPQAQQPTPSVSSYRINPGDELEIYVWGEERLQRVLRVLPDGTIAFPLVGQLKVAGFLPQQVEAMVSERLQSQYRGDVPFVTVSVSAPDGMQFSVMGKVRAPGSFSVGRYVNVLDALSLAGGPAEFANLGKILVISHRGDQLVTTTVKLDDLFKGGASTRDVQQTNIVQIMPGDIVIVP
jgi:polysaccharide export outer membrane protein